MNATMPAKQIPVARPSFGLGEEKAILEVLGSGGRTQGPRVAEFERKFAEYVGAPHAVAVLAARSVANVQRRRAAIDKVEAILGFKAAVSLQEGLSALVQWRQGTKTALAVEVS